MANIGCKTAARSGRSANHMALAVNESSGSLRFATARLAWLCTLVAFLTACGTEPEPSLVYSLARVPAPTDAARWPDGTLRVIEALEGRLTLSADGSFKYEIRSRRTVDGVPVEIWDGRRSLAFMSEPIPL